MWIHPSVMNAFLMSQEASTTHPLTGARSVSNIFEACEKEEAALEVHCLPPEESMRLQNPLNLLTSKSQSARSLRNPSATSQDVAAVLDPATRTRLEVRNDFENASQMMRMVQVLIDRVWDLIEVLKASYGVDYKDWTGNVFTCDDEGWLSAWRECWFGNRHD